MLAFDEASKPTANSELHAALGHAYTAENRLNELRSGPSSGEITAAEAQVAKAAAEVAAFNNDSTDSDLLLAELKVEQALIDLHVAQTKLVDAQIVAPIDGTILEINSELGEMLAVDTVVAILADLSHLELTVDVSEIDIPSVTVGQSVSISLDALPDQSIIGTVEQIIPNGSAEQGVVNYPVTIRLINDTRSQILPGMTAVAVLSGPDVTDNSWLVPTSSIEKRDSNNIVSVVRRDERIDIPIEPTETQGEWTIVRSDDLQLGAQVWAVLTSYVDRDAERLFGS